MQDPTGERLKTLCEAASTEQDFEKFLGLITEINDLLEQRRRHRAEIDKAVTDTPHTDHAPERR
jgi:hypothetical protein